VVQAVAEFVNSVTTSWCVSSDGREPCGGEKLQTRYATGKARVGAESHASDTLVHPRAAALAGPGIEVEEESRARPSGTVLHREETHIGVVDLDVAAFDDLEP
jgi:hypothetical protein